MRPLTLQVEGLRSFRSAGDPIVFDSRDYIAIIGDTGAGKSSILEAMTWALYGQTSWSGQPNQELMNDTSTQLRVVLTFRIRGERWRVTRTLRRAGDGTVGAPFAELVHLGDDDTTIEAVPGVRAVEARVEALLGLNFAAFQRTVVLPQGQFAQLLVADKPTERSQVLEQVWRIDELKNGKISVDALLSELRPLAGRVDEALVGMPTDPVRHLEELRNHADTMASAAAAAGSRADAARDARDQLTRARAALGVARAATAALVAQPGLIDQAERVRAGSDELTVASERLSAETNDCNAALSQMPTDDDGLSATEVATVQGYLQRVPGLAEKVRSHNHKATSVRDAASAAKDVSIRAGEAAALADSAEQQHRRQRGELRNAAEAARGTVDAARQAIRDWRHAADRVASLRGDAATAQERRTRAGREVSETATTAASARERAEEAWAAKQLADREHAAVAAASGLHAGDECSVCQRPLPEGWTAPSDAVHEQIATAANQAQSAATDAAGQLADARAEEKAALSDLNRVAEASMEATRALDGHAAAVAQLVGLQPRPRSDDAALLAELAAAEQAAQQQLAEHDDEATVLAAIARDAHSKASAAAARSEAALAAASQAERTVEDAWAELREVHAAVPQVLSVGLDQDGATKIVVLSGIDAAKETLADREATLASRRAQRERLHARLRELSSERENIQQRRAREVDEPLGDLAGVLERYRHLVIHYTTALQAGQMDTPSLVNLLPEHATTIVQNYIDSLAGLRDVAQLRGRHAISETESARQVLSAEAAALELDAVEAGGDGGGAVKDGESVAATLATLAENATFEARSATKEARDFGDRLDAIQGLQHAQNRLVEQQLVLEDLSAALQKGAFPRWLTMRRSRDLLVHASALLTEMTAGRYSFAEIANPEDPWKIIDNDSGLPRSPASLSGGEKFVASLALALGMVEMMARAGGRLESLWLDEGFGALDRSNLDAAVDALSQVAARGRMVAVISHVRGVAEQVGHVLAVTRSATGSKARWLTVEERSAAAEADSLGSDEALGAVAGLLD